jgi:hypothetical protein
MPKKIFSLKCSLGTVAGSFAVAVNSLFNPFFRAPSEARSVTESSHNPIAVEAGSNDLKLAEVMNLTRQETQSLINKLNEDRLFAKNHSYRIRVTLNTEKLKVYSLGFGDEEAEFPQNILPRTYMKKKEPFYCLPGSKALKVREPIGPGRSMWGNYLLCLKPNMKGLNPQDTHQNGKQFQVNRGCSNNEEGKDRDMQIDLVKREGRYVFKVVCQESPGDNDPS